MRIRSELAGLDQFPCIKEAGEKSWRQDSTNPQSAGEVEDNDGTWRSHRLEL